MKRKKSYSISLKNMKSADQMFQDLEERREILTQKIMSGYIPKSLSELFDMDTECIWHAGHCISDDPEKRVMEEGCFLDSIRARHFQCKGCSRISLFCGTIHQHEPIETFRIMRGVREGMEFKVQLSHCSHDPTLHYNVLTNELRTPRAIHDTLLHFLIQKILEKHNFWNIERVYDTYICGEQIISIKENPMLDICSFKITKSFALSSFCSTIQFLLHLRPYHFIFGGVNRHSFLFNSIPCEGRLGQIAYKSKNSLKIKDFSMSSMKVKNSCKEFQDSKMDIMRLVPYTPYLDSVLRHSEARIQITHNHHEEAKKKSCPLYRKTYRLYGLPQDIERARHMHFSETINFSLNVYVALSAIMTISQIHDKVFEDKTSKHIWTSVWPHGESQMLKISNKLRNGSGSSGEILQALMNEDLYLEPFLNK